MCRTKVQKAASKRTHVCNAHVTLLARRACRKHSSSLAGTHAAAASAAGTVEEQQQHNGEAAWRMHVDREEKSARARKAAFSVQVRSLRDPTFSKQNSHRYPVAGKNFACGARGLRRSLRATARSGQNRPPWPSPSSPSPLPPRRCPRRLALRWRRRQLPSAAGAEITAPGSRAPRHDWGGAEMQDLRGPYEARYVVIIPVV